MQMQREQENKNKQTKQKQKKVKFKTFWCSLVYDVQDSKFTFLSKKTQK